MNEILDLFNEYDSDVISVGDFNITVRGTQVNYLKKNDDNSISIWTGDPDTDKYSEELMLDKSELDYVFEEVLNYM